MNPPLLLLYLGLAFWAIPVSVLWYNPNKDCGGFQSGDLTVYSGQQVTLLERTGPWGDKCYWWVESHSKKFVINSEYFEEQ
jgi:hypothetical protein